MKADLVIRGMVVTPEGTFPEGWVAISGETIAAVGQGPAPEASESFDAGDALVLPGVVDGQTHAGSFGGLPGMRSTTRSAIAGGVTTIVDMPYDNPHPLNTRQRLEEKTAAIGEHAHSDVALYGTVIPGQTLDAVADLVDGGVVAFKISAFESSPTRFPRIDAAQTLDLLEALAPTRLPLGLHNEDQEIVLSRIARAREAGENGIAAHSASRPEAAEHAATAQFLELGAAAGAHVHPVHLTTARGFALVDHYRQDGFRATGELCVHYLWFDPERDGAALGPLMKVNPPIRPAMTDALWRELEAGRVAFVSSDHSSWPNTNKFTPSIFEAGAGVPGLETLLPAFYTLAHARAGEAAAALTARYLSECPAKFFGLWPQKGALARGADADIAIVSPGAHVWRAADAHDDLNWSPFEGRQFAGRVTRTYLRGRLAWDGAAILNPPGAGRYVPRGAFGWDF
jgi:allantoinase